MLSRREILSAALVGLSRKAPRPIAGGFANESHGIGHALRDGKLRRGSVQTVRVPVVIVGGGIAGLSAAWRLEKRRFHDFVLLEMEELPGGNSRWGENEVSPYPWGAHYVPVPGRNQTLARELMEDLGVLRNGIWEERFMCFSPQERLFVHGRWQEGFEPDTKEASLEWRRFEQRMREFGAMGQFRIPVPEHPVRPELDRVSMRDWLVANKFVSPHLSWYVDYACRDDYGARSADVSAWMGIHYFASRDREEKGPLTWPEGNGWIVKRISERLRKNIRVKSPVFRISRMAGGWEIQTPETMYRTSFVIFAAPTFLARHVVEGAPSCPMTYSPWITANITLDRLPRETGFEPAWDNVIRDSDSLGYVVANHMSVASRRERSVWTWYMPLTDADTTRARRTLLSSKWEDWKEAILQDLSRAHPDIRDCVARVDVMRFGHAMARPTAGTIFDPRRRALARSGGRLFYANSDLSGYSIFEEAQYRGVRAAEAVLRVV